MIKRQLYYVKYGEIIRYLIGIHNLDKNYGHKLGRQIRAEIYVKGTKLLI